MKVWESPFRSPRSAAVIAGGVAVVVFLNSLANEFAIDDLFILLGNPLLRDLKTLPEALLGTLLGREVRFWTGPLATRRPGPLRAGVGSMG